MPVRSRILTAMLGLTAAAGIGGCGDSGDGAAADARPYADANRICIEVAKRFEDLQKDSPRSFEQGEQLLTVLSQTAQDGARALDQVEAPALQALAFERYVKSRDRVGDLIDRGVQAAKDEQGETYEDLRVTVNDGAGARRKLAEQAGLKGCADAEDG